MLLKKIITIIAAVILGVVPRNKEVKNISLPAPPANTPTPTLTPTITPTPTPRPLTFAEMNQKFGPCAVVRVLLYHHILSPDQIRTEKRTSLTVDSELFRRQMQYLRDKGYSPIEANQLIAFFDQGSPLPPKPVIVTFDDGYNDFATNAVPILNEFDIKAIVFVPTGLMDNPSYLSWENIKAIASSGKVRFANHTWSHRNVASTKEVIEKEITVADSQLTDRGLNQPKIFAYPYGSYNFNTEKFLESLGYQIAFSTRHSSILCKKQRLELPRIRIGNAVLSAYGL